MAGQLGRRGVWDEVGASRAMASWHLHYITLLSTDLGMLAQDNIENRRHDGIAHMWNTKVDW